MARKIVAKKAAPVVAEAVKASKYVVAEQAPKKRGFVAVLAERLAGRKIVCYVSERDLALAAELDAVAENPKAHPHDRRHAEHGARQIRSGALRQHAIGSPIVEAHYLAMLSIAHRAKAAARARKNAERSASA